MTNKLVVVINSVQIPKIKTILLCEMKFIVPNYSCLQNLRLGGYRPQIPVLSVLCPQLNLLTPPPETKFMGTPLPIPLSEKLIPIQQTARRHFPGDRDLIAHRRENLKLNVDVILEKVRNVHW
jgi:hypothetical protein